MKKIALVVGATGLVGSQLVQTLLDAEEYSKVIIWVRRPTRITHEKLEEVNIDYEKLEEQPIDPGIDTVFCCLGTTIKKAKTKEAFKKVDFDYPFILAQKAKNARISYFSVISAMGANEKSSLFYSQTKGQLEAALRDIGFRRLSIFRPSLLLGRRDEFRLGEGVAAVLMSKILPFMFHGPLKRYRPIKGAVVAKAMYLDSLKPGKGSNIYQSYEIAELVKK